MMGNTNGECVGFDSLFHSYSHHFYTCTYTAKTFYHTLTLDEGGLGVNLNISRGFLSGFYLCRKTKY